MNKETTSINSSQFGKDHWSLFGYVEDRCVNGREGFGTLDRDRLRCNINRHPMLASPSHRDSPWKLSYSTRLYGFFQFSDKDKPESAILGGFQIRDHDDWDCLDDLDAAGFIEVISTVNGYVKLTKIGMRVAASLRAHKANGGSFANFSPNDLKAA